MFSDQEQRWLAVQVQGQPEPSRVLLVSVPYAFKAHEAETLGGLPASAFVKTAPDATNSGSADAGITVNALNIAANTGTTMSAKVAAGSAKAGPLSLIDCGTMALGYIPWVFAVSTTPPYVELCDSVIFQQFAAGPTNNFVGIQTATPGAQLDVNGGVTSGINTTNNRKAYMIGLNTVLSIFGTQNLFTGVGAGTSNATGHDNTFSGFQAGNANVGGLDPLGSYNTFSGSQAGLFNNTGFQNTFSGYHAGFLNNAGDTNSCYGFNSCLHNTTGIHNVAVGAGAGFRNDVGNFNTYVGTNSGFGSIVGGTTGNNNTFTGWESGFNYTTGGNNVFNGYRAGFADTTGNSNIAIAANAGSTANPIQSNNIYIGNPGQNESFPAIRIGVQGLQKFQTYIAGIWPTLIPLGVPVFVDATGHLGIGLPITSTPVTGSCNPPGAFFLTKWNLSNSVQCSRITELSTGTWNVGIGPLTTSPTRQLQVNGDIDIPVTVAAHYQITGHTVLSIDGTSNVFVGVGAGVTNPGGQQNTYTGEDAGAGSDGYGNSFYGWLAGASNTSGLDNTCVGWKACVGLVKGIYNTFLGAAAASSFNGNYNSFVGYSAGVSNTAGNNNIYVGSGGVAAESSRIRIGGAVFGTGFGPQTDTYIAGIYHSAMSSPPLPYETVCVDSSGKLFSVTNSSGCSPSSRRFKDQIADMGDSSNKLFQLRPVTFYYKPQNDDGSHLLQYGLIAEEVAKVFPELAAYEKDGTTPYTVKYQLLTPMLLNELQKQHAVVSAQQQQLETQGQKMLAQQHEIEGLKSQLQLQNAAFQERLSRLESLVTTQMQTAAADKPAQATTNASGGLQ
ncbi:MAG TPA: tail fiber domain-containing protein [Terriglobales bacterium]